MIINKSKILQVFSQLKTEQTITSLRNTVLHLRQQLTNSKSDKTGLINIDSNGDTIKITQKYLFDEIKQIKEAKTFRESKILY